MDERELKNKPLLTGELVRLTAVNPETDSGYFVKWGRDSEYLRMLDADPVRLWSQNKYKEWLEKDLEKEPANEFLFLICTLEGDEPIGFVELDGIHWNHGDAWVGIGIGPREYWNRGYGSDAMEVVLRYAFEELNLQRISLTVFDYNQRAIRSYEKSGFVVEGRGRQFLKREGRRWDILFMGLLRTEWEDRRKGKAINAIPES